MIPFILNKTEIVCPYGRIGAIKEHYIGVNTYTAKYRDACMVNQTKYDNHMCSNFPNKKDFIVWWAKTCVGKTSCEINIDVYKDIKNKADAVNEKFNVCFDKKNDFFFQYECL